MTTPQLVIIAILGTLVMVGGFSYITKGFLYEMFTPSASKNVMKRANARVDSSKWY